MLIVFSLTHSGPDALYCFSRSDGLYDELKTDTAKVKLEEDKHRTEG